MPVSIIVGGQYGSEGKGKVAYEWAKKMHAVAAVRVGGTNSGHTVCIGKKEYIFCNLPTASLLEGTNVVLPAGSYIDLDILRYEIELSKIERKLIKIDPNAVIIQSGYKELEKQSRLRETIGSTLSGTGAAVMARVCRNRQNPVVMAKDVEELKEFLTDTKSYLRGLLNEGKEIVIEGTQGFGLSNYHAKTYPYVTSRDTTAAAFLSEVGLSPFDVGHVVMVIRSYPIRVAGDSGPLTSEISWETVTQESGADEDIIERTSVTRNVRRVARFSPEIVCESLLTNRPDIVVLNHVDYIDYKNRNNNILSDKQLAFVEKIENEIHHKIQYVGNGRMGIIERI